MNKFGRVYKRIVMVGFVRFGLMEQRVAQGLFASFKDSLDVFYKGGSRRDLWLIGRECGMGLYKRREYHGGYARRAELLAPAGSYDAMVAAVLAGADAVYLGGRLFGARAYAHNFDTEELKAAIDFVHLHGRKLYLTVNTLVKELEMQEKLYSYLAPFYQQGLDAVIVQDIGVLSFIRRNFPGLSVHASTQMTLTGAYGAKLLKDMGAVRIVTARELSLGEIQMIHDTEGLETLEIESFVHGALCYCYSGQCLFSSIAGGRSGNRGRCAQPCRLPYQVWKEGRRLNRNEELYLLSPKDLCSIELLPDILDAGVYSLKIEGRMKKPEYTAGVVSVYRKYLDFYLEHGRTGFSVSDEDKRILKELYNRGGFTKGYYVERNGRDMMFFEGKEAENGGKEAENGGKKKEILEEVQRCFLSAEPKEAVCGTVVVRCGERVQLTVRFRKQSVTVFGAEVALAQKQVMTPERIRKQIEKTGGTPFYFSDLSVETDGRSFISVTELNELRRNALEQLTVAYLKPFYRKEERKQRGFEQGEDSGKDFREDFRKNLRENEPIGKKNLKKQEQKQEKKRIYEVNVYLEKKEFVLPVASFAEVSAIYLDASEFSAEDIRVYKRRFPEKRFYYMLPPVFRDTTQVWLEQEYPFLLQAGVDGFVVRNLDELSFLFEKETTVPIRLDSSLYAFNLESMRVFEERFHAEMVTLSLELNKRELAQIADGKSEMVVYGYLPMMVSAQCMMKNQKGCCHKSGVLTLTDRYHNDFLIKNRCKFCYNRIYNCKPLSLLSAKQDVDFIAPYAVRLDFTLESAEEVTEILSYFIQAYQADILFSEEPFLFTRGHLKRGVE